MNTKLKLSLIAVAILGSQINAQAADSFTMTAGNGSKANTTALFTRPTARVLPITAEYSAHNWTYQFKVKYQRAHVLIGSAAPDLKLVQTENNGDAQLLTGYVVKDSDVAVTYKVPTLLPGKVRVEITGGVEFKNLRASKALVDIQRSYKAQLDFTRKFGALKAKAGLGYEMPEQRPGNDARNSASVYFGGEYDLTNRTSVELYYDVRQGSTKKSLNEAELTAYVNHQLPSKNLSLQGYAFKGMSQDYRNTEVGIALKMSF